MTRRYRFVWVDVFAKSPLEGNPLAVFPESLDLSDEEMQSIARETHLSETTFVFPSDDKKNREEGFRTRIFAVAGEMPFAGHPTLGTASVLSRLNGLSEVALSLKVGKIPVKFSIREGHPFGEMTQKDPEIGRTHDAVTVAKTLSVEVADIDATVPIQTISTGVPFAIVPFKSLRSISRAHPDMNAMEDYLRETDAKFFYMISRETVDPAASLHARMIFPGGEDPATGSAAGCAVAWMVLHGFAKPDESLMIEQGLEIHRTSRIYGRADLREKRPVNVRIGGHCTEVIQGELEL